MTNINKIKVVHMTSVHPPFDVRVFHKECKSLVNAGFDVTLVAPHDKNEIIDGVKIMKVTKAKSRVKRMIFTTWEVYRRASRLNASIYHLHDPELIPMGLLLKWQGNHVVYDDHEDLPLQVLNKPYIPKLLKYLILILVCAFEKIAGSVFDKTIIVDDNMGFNFRKSKLSIIANYPILSEIKNIQSKNYKDRDNIISYTGAISKARGICETVESLSKISSPNDLKFVLAGFFSSNELHEEAKRLNGWEKVEYRGRVSKNEVFEIMSISKIGMSIFHPVPQYTEHVIATKVLEFMAFGIPVILSDFPNWRKFYEPLNCAIFVDPMNIDELAKTITWLLENPEKAEELGNNGKVAVHKYFNWSHEANKLVDLYNSILISF